MFKKNIPQLCITPSAAAELVRQSAFAGTPGHMSISLESDKCLEGWLHIKLVPGSNDGLPVARCEGVTLFASEDHLPILAGLKLNYFGDLSGGGFLISSPENAEGCACGSGFRFLK